MEAEALEYVRARHGAGLPTLLLLPRTAGAPRDTRWVATFLSTPALRARLAAAGCPAVVVTPGSHAAAAVAAAAAGAGGEEVGEGDGGAGGGGGGGRGGPPLHFLGDPSGGVTAWLRAAGVCTRLREGGDVGVVAWGWGAVPLYKWALSQEAPQPGVGKVARVHPGAVWGYVEGELLGGGVGGGGRGRGRRGRRGGDRR